MMAKDPVKASLKAAKRDGDRRAQSNDRETSEQGSADWHAADDALRALNNKR